PGHGEVLLHLTGQAFARSERSEWRCHRQKHLSMRTGWTILPQVGEDRFAHRHGQRISRVVARLPTPDVNELTAPIKIVQTKMNDLDGPDTIDRQEQHHRIIPTADGRLTVDRCEHGVNLSSGQEPRTLRSEEHTSELQSRGHL